MEIFRSFGIDDAVRQGGWRVIPRQATVTRLDDRQPVEGPLGFPDEAAAAAVSPTIAAVSPQDYLEPVLVEELRRLGGAVRFSTELAAFHETADAIEAVLVDRITGQRTAVRAAYVVGADGHRSTVRTALGIPMEGPDDLGQYLSILFCADLDDVLGEQRYGLYLIEGQGPPTVFVPSGADDRYVLALPLPTGMDDAAIAAAFPLDRCVALIRAAAGRPDLDVEILATGAFAFSAQVATDWRVGRTFLVGDAAHRMTPRGGRGMNTAIADAHDLGWKLGWVIRGLADPGLLDSYEAERGPVGRRNVEMSMIVGGGGSDDGLIEDLGPVVASDAIVAEPMPAAAPEAAPTAMVSAYVPDARPGARAPHVWLGDGGDRRSTLDLFGRELVLMVAGQGSVWPAVAAAYPGPAPLGVHEVDASGFAAAYGLAPGGAVLVRPDGVVAWRSAAAPADLTAATEALGSALALATGRGSRMPVPATAPAIASPTVRPGLGARVRAALVRFIASPEVAALAWGWVVVAPRPPVNVSAGAAQDDLGQDRRALEPDTGPDGHSRPAGRLRPRHRTTLRTLDPRS